MGESRKKRRERARKRKELIASKLPDSPVRMTRLFCSAPFCRESVLMRSSDVATFVTSGANYHGCSQNGWFEP